MTEKLPEPVATLLNAVNAGDTQRFLASFTEDGVVDDWGREFRGTEPIRGWSDAELIGKRATLDVSSVVNVDDKTTVIAQVGGDGFNGPSTFEFAINGDRVARMTIRA